MNEAKRFLKNLLKKNDVIVIGVSGGPDSMFLLNLLLAMKDNLNLKIICAHVNHGIRKESIEEEKFVENYCVINNIIFESKKIENYRNNKFSENEAHKIRYQFFDSLVTKYNANYLMTAHHGNDLEETILMRIVRGSNLKGYIGIPKINKNKNYLVVRPLLTLNKQEIKKYLDEHNIKYYVDKSNTDLKYTRNRYRQKVLPFLEQEDANVHLKFVKFSEELNDYQNYINKIIEQKMAKIYVNNNILLDKFLKEDKFIQRKIIEKIIEYIQVDDTFNINDKQLTNIFKLIENSHNKEINLANNYIAQLNYNKLYIGKKIEYANYNFLLDKKVIINNKYVIEKIDAIKDTSNNVIRLDSQELNLPLYVRNYLKGDRIKIKNLNGSKKISDIFIDLKIDKNKRKVYPVVVDSKNTVIWLPGLKKSTFDKDISEKYDIILKYTEEKNE